MERCVFKRLPKVAGVFLVILFSERLSETIATSLHGVINTEWARGGQITVTIQNPRNSSRKLKRPCYVIRD